MTTTIIPILIVIVFPAYFIWRYWAALDIREKVAIDVDNYLGQEKPNDMKHIIYHAFNDCLSIKMPFQIMFNFIFNSKRGNGALKRLKTESGTEGFKELSSLLVKIFIVNASRYPLSYFSCGVVVFIIALFRVISSSSIFKIKSRAENAVFKTVA